MSNTKQGLVWIKGFSSSGKTTVARYVEQILKKEGCNVISLDGDELRAIFSDKWGYDTDSRKELASAYFRLCSHLSSQGYIVIISAVAMFDEIEEWVHSNILNSIQIFLNVPINERKLRDQNTKRIFVNKDFNDKEYDLPKNSDLVIKNYGEIKPIDTAKKIVDFFLSNEQNSLDRKRTEHWGNYYAENNAPNNPSSFARKVLKNIKKGSRILEIGCGNGRDARFFESSGLIVDAIDRSKDAIDLCKKMTSSINFYAGDIKDNLSLTVKNKYDYVYCRFVIHAMPVEEETELILHTYRALKKGGAFLVECRSINDPLSRKGEIISSNERSYGHYRRFIVLDELKENLINHGFKIQSAEEESNISRYEDDNPVLIRCIAIKD
jgi:bifunctional enzyme CysN/CysC